MLSKCSRFQFNVKINHTKRSAQISTQVLVRLVSIKQLNLICHSDSKYGRELKVSDCEKQVSDFLCKERIKGFDSIKFFRIFWAHGHTLSHNDNSNSVAWCSPNRTRTWVELWVAHCLWLISTDSLETTSIWTTLEYANNFMTSGKYTSFVEIENNCDKRNKKNIVATSLPHNRLGEKFP